MSYLSDFLCFDESYPFEKAMDLAIESCIKNDILAEFLSRNRAEVLRTSIFEYDQEKHIKQEKEESWEEGRAQGRTEGIQKAITDLVARKVRKGITLDEIAEDLECSKEEIAPIYNMVLEETGAYCNDSDRDK